MRSIPLPQRAGRLCLVLGLLLPAVAYAADTASSAQPAAPQSPSNPPAVTSELPPAPAQPKADPAAQRAPTSAAESAPSSAPTAGVVSAPAPVPAPGTTPAPAAAAPATSAAESPARDDSDEQSTPKKKKKKKHEAKAGGVETDSALAPGDPFGETEPDTRLGPIAVRGMLQMRFAKTLAGVSQAPDLVHAVQEDTLLRENDGFRLQRLFLRLNFDANEIVNLKAVVDFAELVDGKTENFVKQAYIGIHPFGKQLDVMAGVLKLPFSSLELDPVARFEFSDLGVADDLIKDLGFAGHDLGAQVVVAPLEKPRWLKATLGAYRGHSHDEHASIGDVGARIESEVLKGLRLGVDYAWQPYDVQYKQAFSTSDKDLLPNPPDPLFPASKYWTKGHAASADIAFSRYHFTARIEGMLGDRTDSVTAYGAQHFAGAWALIAYRFRAGPVHFRPGIRGEWFDANSMRAGGRRRLISAAWTTFFSKHLQLLLDASYMSVEANSPVLDSPKPFPTDPYRDLSHTRLSAQLQAEL